MTAKRKHRQRWTPEEIAEVVSLSHHYTIPQIARSIKASPHQVRTLVKRINPDYTRLHDVAMTGCATAAMIGVHHSSVTVHINAKRLSAQRLGRSRGGFGVRWHVDIESLYELAKTPWALEWRITDATPNDLAAIIVETKRQWMHVDDFIAACPLVYTEHRPWNHEQARMRPVMHRGNGVYYLKSSLYEVMYHRYVRNLDRRVIKARWLLTLYDAWHDAHITTKAMLALGIASHYICKATPIARGVYRRKDIVAVLRQFGFDDMARQVLGSEVPYIEQLHKDDLP